MERAFEGVNILDFSWVITGPQATKLLANLGATVVRVESQRRLDIVRPYPPFPGGISGVNRSATFANYNDGKYGISLDLGHPRAREVVERLVRWAGVVVENFAAGAMERWKLAYEDLREIKPDIIMLRASLMGQTGPYSRQPGFGTMLQAYAGFSYLIGWPDRMPVGTSVPWTDYPGVGFTAIAILAALDCKRRTGEGVYIDLSQLEAAQQFLAPALLDCAANGRVWERMANRHTFACPHGAYPCRGEDRWCLIAVFSDEEWEVLKRVMGYPQWAEEERFSTLRGRKKSEDELDQLIAAWTVEHDAEELMWRLQEAGVPAGMVENGRNLHQDPQLKHREHFVKIEHPEMGATSYDAPPFRLSLTPHRMDMPAPCLGQHTEFVCREFLGMSDEQFLELLFDGVFD